MNDRQKKIIQDMHGLIIKDSLADIRRCIENDLVFHMINRIGLMNRMKEYMKELEVIPHFHSEEDVETIIIEVSDYCRTHNINLNDFIKRMSDEKQ